MNEFEGDITRDSYEKVIRKNENKRGASGKPLTESAITAGFNALLSYAS
jgi:hypothetical protein